MALVDRVNLDGRLATWLLARRDRARHRRRVRLANDAVRLGFGTRTGAEPVRLHEVLACSNDVTVALVHRGGRDAVLKLAMSTAADRGVDHHVAMVRSLAELGAGPTVVPTIIEDGNLAGRRYVIETVLAGRPLTPHDGPAAHAAALDVIGHVHATTMRSIDLDLAAAAARRWVDPHVAAIEAAVSRPEDAATVRRLGATLAERLSGAVHHVCTTHGDWWPGNVMGVGAGRDWTITGVIDWENGDLAGLPELDLVHYALAIHPGGLMRGVLDHIDGPRCTVAELLHPFRAPMVHPMLDATVVVVLAWLTHVGAGLTRSGTFALGPVWRDRHLRPMIELVGETDLLERLGASPTVRRSGRGVVR